MSELCEWLHSHLEYLPTITYPFHLSTLPRNGIYFFYEEGERWGHGSPRLRIVRIGTHKDGNFRSRISEHFLFNDAKMDSDQYKPKPSDRSIFRKNIGRALLNRDGDCYLTTWDIDFMSRVNRTLHGSRRDIDKERRIESQITDILRTRFAFKYIVIERQIKRMGSKGLESSLISTVANCPVCQPSANWLGKYSPKRTIRQYGVWQVQHITSKRINDEDMNVIENAISRTKLFRKQ